MIPDGIQQCNGSSDIIPIVLVGRYHRLAYIGKGGKMPHCYRLIRAEQVIQNSPVTDVSPDERPLFDRPLVTINQVVNSNWQESIF